ncbi:MAG: Na+/H+ antiporter NhaC family protein [Melioribacteraceae bacterium]|nr:Na+/H+ antiporter NhaC family protein [Melioribacteraceae bacterium]
MKDSIIDTSIAIDEPGSYQIITGGNRIAGTLRILPGWLSIIPPLLAILLALIVRQVVTALLAGIYAGALFIYDFNPLAALLRVADTFMVDAVIDRDHMFIILFTLLIGGVVGIITQNGGTRGLANKITHIAKTARSGMTSSWLMGIFIFFDDYANSLIIGNMMRPITDKLKISREKLSYIVDSTAAPVTSVMIISTWIGYEVGLINDGLKIIGSHANAYDTFIQTIPYSFYPLGAIFFVFLIASTGRDFGPMYKAEMRARIKGIVANNSPADKKLKNDDTEFYMEGKPRWYNAAVPILIILFGTITGLIVTGVDSLNQNGVDDYSLQSIINHSDSYSSLLWASFIACIVAVLMSVIQRILTLEESIQAWQKGIQSMMVAVIILVFAWSISSVTHQLYTADYIISIISETMDPRLLPALIFIVCAITAFSTGTSWGTMAIVMPIVIPLTHKLGVSAGLQPDVYYPVLYGVISSVLAGSVFGDHCSPIADTTILSSLASKCNHIDHVNTQLPYAVITGISAVLIGYLPSAFGVNPFISLITMFIVLFLIVYFVGKPVPEAKTD